MYKSLQSKELASNLILYTLLFAVTVNSIDVNTFKLKILKMLKT